MRNLLIVISVFGSGLFYLNANQGDYSILPQTTSTSAAQEQFFEIADLYDSETTFMQLSEADAYTIVEVYADNCGRCKVLEASFPSLLRQRDDIVIKRVKTFSGRISFDSESEGQKWFDHQEAMMKFYKVKGTPHIEIYDAYGKALAKDNMGSKNGTGLLTEILKASSKG
ncbi:MAG: hypothetical protein ACI9FB_002217 [Candidatus Azotimanducaceae bacterium]